MEYKVDLIIHETWSCPRRAEDVVRKRGYEWERERRGEQEQRWLYSRSNLI